ncbi:MAG: YaaA family protein, partial [Arcobacter sp.]|nr:YaaA family protein [Arcobacter sp.]
MKILLAPAETKSEGGECLSLSEGKNLFFDNDEVLDIYENYLKNSSVEELSHWFGLKNLKECEKYKSSILDKPTKKAIERYDGVAFEAIDYNNLDPKAQEFIDEHVMIYSNLFGILKADSLIPDYKFKQGSVLPNLNTEKYYAKHLKEKLDKYLDDEVLDLSAGYYLKFYKPTANVITYKFLKDGKVVSHFAKHYRGELVKQIALHNISSFAELMNFKFENLTLLEMQQKKNV